MPCDDPDRALDQSDEQTGRLSLPVLPIHQRSMPESLESTPQRMEAAMVKPRASMLEPNSELRIQQVMSLPVLSEVQSANNSPADIRERALNLSPSIKALKN